MRSLRWTLPLVTCLTVFAAKSAWAVPAVTLSSAVVTRYASDKSTPYGCPGRNSQSNSCIVDGTSQGVGYHDCLDDTTLKFALTLTGVPDANYGMQIWAGTTDCTASGATNNATTGTCWPVAASPALGTQLTLFIRVADLVSSLGQAPPLPQTYDPNVTAATSCGSAAASSTTTTVTDDAGNSTATAGESTVTIYFMIFQNGQYTTPVSSANYSVKVKLVGPNACTNVVAGTGDGELVVTWDPPAGDTTVQGYNLYAAADGTVLGDAGQTVCTDASTGTELFDDAGNAVLDDAGNPIFVDDAGNPVTQDAGCTTTGPSTATCSGSSGSIDVSSISCPSGGDAGAAICSQVIGTTNSKGTISGLTNGTSYVVAVAAFDQFGNAGAVSNASCSTPQPIDDFWKIYNQDGGNASCALEVVGTRGGGAAAALMSIVGLVFLRRRRAARR